MDAEERTHPKVGPAESSIYALGGNPAQVGINLRSL